MKTNVNSIEITERGRIQLESTLVPESVTATRSESLHPHVFGIADLWKLERSRRTRGTRRHIVL